MYRKLFPLLAAVIMIFAASCTPSPGGTDGTTTTTTPTAHAPFSRPLVSFEFDDGWQSAYKYGLPVMKSFGFKPTMYIITDTAENNADYGVGTYMTPAQIQDWVAQGGDIGVHTVDHTDLTTLTQAQAQAQLVNSNTYLTNLLGKAPSLFATPYCASNAMVTNLARQYYQGMRNCDDPTNKLESWDPYNIHSISIENGTTMAEIQGILADTIASNGWTVLAFHEVGTPINPADPTYSVSVAQLTAIAQAVKDSGVTVVSTQEALNESIG